MTLKYGLISLILRSLQVTRLKSEKRQLLTENEELKQELQTYKSKSEEKIAQLRNKIAKTTGQSTILLTDIGKQSII